MARGGHQPRPVMTYGSAQDLLTVTQGTHKNDQAGISQL